MPFGGPVDLVDRGAGAGRAAAAAGGGRRRLHRPGAGHRLPQARLRGGGGRSHAAHAARLRRRTDPAGAAPRSSALGVDAAPGLHACRADAGRRRGARAQRQGRRIRACRPTACWWPWAVGRAPRASGSKSLRLDMARPRDRASTTSAAPRCATSGRSATSPASRCWRIARWRRARWWPRSSPAHKRKFAPAAIPAVCFTDPEVVVASACRRAMPTSAGWTASRPPSRSPPTAAHDPRVTEGFVRVVARRDNHLIVGWQAVGRAVSELSAGVLAIDRDGRAAGRRGRHHPRPSDAGRSGAGNGAARAGPGAAYLTQEKSRSDFS